MTKQRHCKINIFQTMLNKGFNNSFPLFSKPHKKINIKKQSKKYFANSNYSIQRKLLGWAKAS
jgi:hypothetical protein